MNKEIQEIIHLLYTNRLSQCGKRKIEDYINNLENYIFKLENDIEELSGLYNNDDVQSLLNQIDKLTNECEKLQKELEQEKEKNKKILGDNIENFRKIFAEEFNKYFISKDKIRALINENVYPDTYNLKTISAKRLKKFLED